MRKNGAGRSLPNKAIKRNRAHEGASIRVIDVDSHELAPVARPTTVLLVSTASCIVRPGKQPTTCMVSIARWHHRLVLPGLLHNEAMR